ncbi:MAG: GNAT family N-acetyltransferase [Asgard group archaeon]|nr:GNAT family N-acetyltransferase [Asgard group archaeon]
MIKINQVKEFEKVKPILISFCKENQLPEDKIDERLQVFEKHFNKDDSIYFLAFVNGETKGYISLDITTRIIQTGGLFVEKCEEYDNILLELLSYSSKELQSLNKEFFQCFFVRSLNIKQQLENDNFNVYPRVKMVYDLIENEIPEHSLHPEYKLDYFTLDKLDEELQVVVDANVSTLDGEIFRQFSDLDSLKELFSRGRMDTDRCRPDSPIVIKDGKIVGVNIIANNTETAAYVWIIALLPEHRGKGIGKYLMLKSHDNCKNAGKNQMVLDVTLGNKVAHGLYQKLGYKETMRYLCVLKKYK